MVSLIWLGGARLAKQARGGKRMDRLVAAEEQIAHLTRTVEDLSEVIARQGDEIDRLTRRVEMLMSREAEGGGGVTLADQKPPHW
jgi:SlyX protein